MSCRTWKLDSVIHSWPTVRSQGWLEEFLETAATDSSILAVVAVGSSVRPGVESDDLDLVVVCEDADEFDYRAPIEVDMRAFDATEVDRELSEGHDLLGWAVEFGEPLLDREETWNELVGRWGGRVPLPDPAVARERARKTHERLEEVRSIGDEAAAIEQELSYWTLIARALLVEAGVHPKSRPELPEQLREIGERSTAKRLEEVLAQRLEEVAS